MDGKTMVILDDLLNAILIIMIIFFSAIFSYWLLFLLIAIRSTPRKVRDLLIEEEIALKHKQKPKPSYTRKA